ncbi:MAG: hypothetical protein PHW82_07240 [Bacteroidales bacterium]|nr:hypothetical protein [Bacteroidales bacterium]
MKNIISILLVATLGVLLTFTGCKEEETVTEPLPMVTVSGTVKADMNLATAGLEAVPNGTKIVFRINSQDLVQTPIAGYTYEVLQYEAIVTDGKYTIQLPTTVHTAVPVVITPVDFQANQTQADNSFKEVTYTGFPSVVNTQKGERFFVNLTY